MEYLLLYEKFYKMLRKKYKGGKANNEKKLKK